MSYAQLIGPGLLFPDTPDVSQTIALTPATIAATGDKIAFCGRVWFNERTGTKAIRRVGFRFGAITKAGGSAMTVSMQDVDLTSGPVIRPDGTQDQTIAIANADAGFASNVWYRTGTFNADRTVTYGDLLAVVLEFDGGGRLGSDSVALSGFTTSTSFSTFNNQLSVVTFVSAAWGNIGALPNIVLEFSDGTFGTLEKALPMVTINSHSIAQNTAVADEYACAFQVPFDCKVDGLWAVVSPSSTSNFNLILYSGTTALQTVAVVTHSLATNSAPRNIYVPIPETALSKNTTYYVSVQPSTNNALSVTSIDVNDANHLNTWPGGINANFATRVDLGAWSAATATRRFLAGARISSVSLAGGMLQIPNLAGT